MTAQQMRPQFDASSPAIKAIKFWAFQRKVFDGRAGRRHGHASAFKGLSSFGRLRFLQPVDTQVEKYENVVFFLTFAKKNLIVPAAPPRHDEHPTGLFFLIRVIWKSKSLCLPPSLFVALITDVAKSYHKSRLVFLSGDFNFWFLILQRGVWVTDFPLFFDYLRSRLRKLSFFSWPSRCRSLQ
jgi:hypothetical protein